MSNQLFESFAMFEKIHRHATNAESCDEASLAATTPDVSEQPAQCGAPEGFNHIIDVATVADGRHFAAAILDASNVNLSLQSLGKTKNPGAEDVSQSSRLVFVRATALGCLEDLYPDDREVPGLYEVQVPGHLSDAHAANCALDGFHSQIPIKWLYTFDVTAHDSLTGKELERDDEVEFYVFAKLCGDVKLVPNFRIMSPNAVAMNVTFLSMSPAPAGEGTPFLPE